MALSEESLARLFDQKLGPLQGTLNSVGSKLDAAIDELKGELKACKAEVANINRDLAAAVLRIAQLEQRPASGSWASGSTTASWDGGTSSASTASSRRVRARTHSPESRSVSSGRDVILVGFQVEVTKTAVEKWLFPIIDGAGQERPEVLCKAGSKSARLVFKTGADARSFFNLHRRSLTCVANSGLVAV